MAFGVLSSSGQQDKGSIPVSDFMRLASQASQTAEEAIRVWKWSKVEDDAIRYICPVLRKAPITLAKST
jgi:hypothetical protein